VTNPIILLIRQHYDKVIFSKQEGFGVIPDVTLTKKDYDSPFGVGAHYARYGDWRVAEIQQALGIAWVRDGCEMESILSVLDEKYARSFYRLFRPSQYLLVAYFRLCGMSNHGVARSSKSR